MMVIGRSSEHGQSIGTDMAACACSMQMHIWRDSHDTQQVRIFSKSKRDSTWDRRETHE